MATIGSLIVNLIANTSVFDSGLRKGQNSLKGFVSGIAKTQRQVMSFAKGLMVVAGVGGLTYMVKKTMDSIEATAELSDRLNITTEDLISLQYAAEQSGMGAEEMNNALSTFVRRVGEASIGGGAAAKTFRELGLSAQQLASNDQAENLKLIADRINQLPTAAERAAVAYDLFGKKGQTMLNLLAGGSAGIDEARKKAEQLGITFSRLDAEQVKAAGDAIKDVKESLTGLAQNAVIQLAPSITVVAEKLSEFIASGNNINDMKAAVEGLTVAFGVIVDVINVIKGVLKGLFGLISGAVTLISQAISGILNTAEAVWNKIVEWQNKVADTKVGEKLGLEKWAPADFTSGIEGFVQQSADLTVDTFVGAWDDITDLSTPKIQKWFDEIDARTAAVKKSFAAQAARNQATAGTGPIQMTEGATKIQEMMNALDMEYSMLGKINEERERAIELAKFQKIVAEEYAFDLQKQNELMQQYSEKLDKIAAGKQGPAAFTTKIQEWGEQATNVWSNLGDVATHALDGISQSLTDMIMSGKANFADLAKSIIADLIQMTIRAQLYAAISMAAGFFSAGTSGVGPGSPGVGTQGPTGMGYAKGGIFALGNVIPFAAGDIFSQPTVFPMAHGNIGMMGEAGTEAIMPLSRGPGGRLGVAVDGNSQPQVNNYNMTINTPDADSFRRSKSQIMAEMKRNRG